ncbi:MAG TPA: Clp protease N-terminal domain-containing protein [Ktedonobacteraceae bacterium]|nr:Clp protease N-terminal domain-containing protein [Ktedonobacteraceae bacterium]
MEHFMTSEEIAELLHVDPVTIRRLVTKGELSAYRIGSDYRFATSDLADYLQRQRLAASAQKNSGGGSSNPLDQFAQVLRNIIQGKHTTPSNLLGRLDDLFTKRVRHVLTLAQEEAQHFHHDYIGTEHLLLGLLRERESVASQVLNNLGIEVDRVRDAVIAIIGHGERVVPGELGLTPRAKKAIELALDEARRFAHRFIGTEHLLLGLIREGDGIAARVLFDNFDLNMQQVRAETLRVLREQPPAPEEASGIPPVPKEATGPLAEEEPGLTCTSCGARCPNSFRYCFNCGQPLTHEDESSQGGQE